MRNEAYFDLAICIQAQLKELRQTPAWLAKTSGVSPAMLSRIGGGVDLHDYIKEFIDLVTDGKDISMIDTCQHCKIGTVGPIGTARKTKFLSYGKYILFHLSLRLGCFAATHLDGQPWLYVNPAGPVVSGQVVLTTETVRVCFDHYCLGWKRGFSWGSPSNFDVFGWLPWTELEDLELLARKLQTLVSPALVATATVYTNDWQREGSLDYELLDKVRGLESGTSEARARELVRLGLVDEPLDELDELDEPGRNGP